MTLEGEGTWIDRYRLLAEIGSGGFGTVWKAEQAEPVRRTVALKIIKLGMDSKQVIARFEAERQALAMMNHPHIATVLDGGVTATGRPYFVMELVQGVAITKYCDDAQLSVAERLALFCDVCRAVQHAHQKGVIHRDIKPSNVLVAQHEGRPAPKVIDFGIAKATSVRLTEKTLVTELRQMMGTPEYMAPEQAEAADLDVDTRADIYSLGVLLYELLTGTKPIDIISRRSYEEILHAIRDVDPPRPSTRVSALGAALEEIAPRRASSPRQLGRFLRGDLDWITLKALEKDRARRYDTATALAEDVERFLSHRPVAATPPTTTYRLRKYVRRHQVGVAAGAIVFLALSAGAVLAWSGYLEARAQRDRAESGEHTAHLEAQRANEVLALVREMLVFADPYSGGREDYTVREVLDRFDAGLGQRLAQDPEVEAEVRRLIGQTYRGLGLADKAEPELRAAFDIRTRVLGEANDQTLGVLGDLAWAVHDLGDFRAAESLARSGLEAARRADRETAAVAHLQYTLGSIVGILGEQEESERLLESALALQTRLLGAESQATLHTQYALAGAFRRRGKLDQAQAAYLQLITGLEENRASDDPFLAMVLDNFAGLLQQRGDVSAAERTFRRSLALARARLGDEHPDVATTLSNLGLLRAQLGDGAEAESLYREALDIYRKRLGEDHPDFVTVTCNLAALLDARGDASESQALLRTALEKVDPSSPQANRLRTFLARRLELHGDLRPAADLRRENVSVERAREPRSAKSLAMELEVLGEALVDLAAAEDLAPAAIEAETVLRECLAECARNLPPDDPTLTLPRIVLGLALTEEARLDASLDDAALLGKLGEAEALLLAASSGTPVRTEDEDSLEIERRSIQGLVRLYEVWDEIEADGGRSSELAVWRAKLGELGRAR